MKERNGFIQLRLFEKHMSSFTPAERVWKVQETKVGPSTAYHTPRLVKDNGIARSPMYSSSNWRCISNPWADLGASCMLAINKTRFLSVTESYSPALSQHGFEHRGHFFPGRTHCSIPRALQVGQRTPGICWFFTVSANFKRTATNATGLRHVSRRVD